MEFLISGFLLVFLIFVSLFLAEKCVDLSYDGRTYHQAAILYLSKGWNPVFQDLDNFSKTVYNTFLHHILWVQNYPKFAEIVESNIFILFNKIEMSKMLNFLLGFILFGYCYSILNKPIFKNIKQYLKILISFLVVANPVYLAQIMTFYVDSYVYLFFMLILLSIIDLHTGLKNKDNIPYVMIVMSSVCLLNVKLGGWLYFILTFVIYLLFLFLQKEKQKLSKLITSFIVILVLFVISGINPCLTNLIVKKRNMFYPLQGSHKIDIITGNSPRKFVKSFYLKSFVISTFSKVDNFNYQSSKNPELKLPFSIYKTELKQLHYVGARVCGFGVFWSGIVILSIILMFFVRYKNKENTKLFKLLLFIMLALLLANPYSWWARYVPHIWAIPLIVSMHLLKQKNKNVVKNILLHALLFIMLANITLQMHQILKMQIVEKNAMAEAIQKLKNKNMHLQIYTIYDYSLIQRLNENKISFELIDSEYFEKHKKDFVFIPIALEDIMYWNNKD